MGLLDDLEQEAQRLRAGADDAARLKQQREEAYRTRLEPGMGALHDYLSKLTKNLALLKPRKTFALPLFGYGDVVFQIEHEYDLKLNAQPAAKEIRLSFPCPVASEECPTVEVVGTTKAKAVASAFQRAQLGGLLEAKKDAGGEVIAATFRAKGKIVSVATFAADAESGVVRMSLANFDQIGGTQTKTYTSEQFNEALFDEIGRFLLREPNSLFKEALPEDFRKQLRTKVQQEELKRKWEAQLAERQREELGRLERDRSLGAKLGKVVDQVKVGGLFYKLKGLVKKDK